MSNSKPPSQILEPNEAPADDQAPASAGGAGKEERIQTALSILGDVEALVWEYDPARMRFNSIEFQGDAYLGLRADEWLGFTGWESRIHPDDVARISGARQTAYENNSKLDIEYRFRAGNDRYNWLREISCVLTAADGSQCTRGVLLDVTSSRHVHGATSEEEQRHYQLIDAMPDPYLIQQDGVIVFANPAANFMLAPRPDKSIVGRRSDEIFIDQHHEKARLDSLLEGRQKVCTSNEAICSLSGKHYEAEVVSCLSLWEGKQAVQTILRDLSWLIEALAMLREEKNLSDLVLNHVADGVCFVDVDGSIKSVNPSAARMFGAQERELLRQPAHACFGHETAVARNRNNAETTACRFCTDHREGRHSEFETEYFRKADQSKRYLHFRSAPIFKNDELVGSVVTVRDLTSEKHTKAEIEKLTSAIEQSPVAITVTDGEGRIEYANPQFYDMLKLEKGSLVREASPLLSDEILPRQVHQAIWSNLNAGKNWEGDIPNVTVGGERLWVRGIISSLVEGQGASDYFLGIYMNVTSEKFARALQKATEDKVNIIFNAIGNAIMTVSETGEIESVNPAAIRLFGYDYKDFETILFSEIIPGFDASELRYATADVLADEDTVGVYRSIEVMGLNKDGQAIPLLMSFGEMPEPEWLLEDRRKSSRRSYICTLQDITEQKNARHAVENAQKMEAIGQLTGGLAHDFNNILGVMIGNLDLADEELDESLPASNYVSTALRAALRGADLTRSLLNFSRSSVVNTENLNVNEVLDELQVIMQPALTARISITQSLDPDIWPVALNKSEFHSALMNLILNARDAMPEGGELKFVTENLDYAEAKPVAMGICPPGQYVGVTITDTGEGMSKATLDKIFEPFFSTKPKGKGTGLGLSTVFGFVNRSNGRIDVRSELDVGTSITLIVPRSEEDETEDVASKSEANLKAASSETVLVVDDEVELAKLCELALQKAGFNVLTASNGAEALRVLGDNPNITLMITDVVMPGELDGIELCAKAVDVNSTVKIILTTGYASKLDNAESLPANCFELIRKPFRGTDLLECVSRVLSQST